MSLKAFHIFFILTSIATCLGFAVWGMHRYSGLAIGLGLFGMGLVVYLIKTIIKFKQLRASS